MPETLLELGKLLHALGEVPAAEQYLREALKHESGDSSLAEAAHFQLAQVYRKLGRAADAERETAAFQQLRAKRRTAIPANPKPDPK
jgi:hypothetical protein